MKPFLAITLFLIVGVSVALYLLNADWWNLYLSRPLAQILAVIAGLSTGSLSGIYLLNLMDNEPFSNMWVTRDPESESQSESESEEKPPVPK